MYECGIRNFMRVPLSSREKKKKTDRNFVDLSTRVFSDLPGLFFFLFLHTY